MPFVGQVLQDVEYFSSGVFVGHKETGMFCNNPLTVQQFYHQAMIKDPDYVCDETAFPFEYDGWNNKWYSPLCRGWYKEQASKPE